MANQKENLYENIAGNIRKERKRLHISQFQLAEKADVSLDTIKSVESGRRTMSLDTYIRIVRALGASPVSLMYEDKRCNYVERFLFLTVERSNGEVEFVLHMVEELLKGHDSYLRG